MATYNILIVDDEPLIRKILRRALSESGYIIEESGSGTSALSHLSVRRFHAVTVDLKMPGMSGLELLVQIKAQYPEIAVVVSTAVNDLSTAVDCMKKGADDYLVKPFVPKDARDVVARALDKRNQRVNEKNNRTALETRLRLLLKDHSEEQKEFLHSVAQDIRTPLTAVIASSELLMDMGQMQQNEEVRRLTGNIKRSAWMLNSNLSQMLKDERDKDIERYYPNEKKEKQE